MNNKYRNIILALFLIAIAGSIVYLQSRKSFRFSGNNTESTGVAISKEAKAKKYKPAQEISTPDGFVNTDSISIGELIGKKVILVDFWTYSCINCQRTTPYLNAWYEKYHDQGLEIIGLHTPEFEFEKDYNNVKAAVEKFGIKFPVVLDNDYSTWAAYRNQYWPRKYLIDIDGYIVYDHIGEGAYDETEAKIQEALREREAILGMQDEIKGGIVTPDNVMTTDARSPQSPEIYFGSDRNNYLGSGIKNISGTQKMSTPDKPKTNVLYLGGTWSFSEEFAENKSNNASIKFRYQGKNVYFVAGSETGSKIKIYKDGNLVGEQEVRDHTLYHLIEDTAYGEHTLEIIIESPGLRAYTFTFG